jgi:hypothetical protein
MRAAITLSGQAEAERGSGRAHHQKKRGRLLERDSSNALRSSHCAQTIRCQEPLSVNGRPAGKPASLNSRRTRAAEILVFCFLPFELKKNKKFQRIKEQLPI